MRQIKLALVVELHKKERSHDMTYAVSNNPVLDIGSFVVAPPHQAHSMIVRSISIRRGIQYDSSLVSLQRTGVDGSLDRPPQENLGHDWKDSVLQSIAPILGHLKEVQKRVR